MWKPGCFRKDWAKLKFEGPKMLLSSQFIKEVNVWIGLEFSNTFLTNHKALFCAMDQSSNLNHNLCYPLVIADTILSYNHTFTSTFTALYFLYWDDNF